jgi:hypothetical protein
MYGTVPKMNRIKFTNLNFLELTFPSFFVRRIRMIASLSGEKSPKFTRGPKLEACTVYLNFRWEVGRILQSALHCQVPTLSFQQPKMKYKRFGILELRNQESPMAPITMFGSTH